VPFFCLDLISELHLKSTAQKMRSVLRICIMRSVLLSASIIGLALTGSVFAVNAQNIEPVIAIHGGSGTIPRGSLTPELEAEYRAAMLQATKAGQDVLVSGGSALDAVVAAVKVMEDSPLFNAGKGAVFTSEGKNEMDASIMDGNGTRAGAVAGVRRVKNPITAARAVMDKSRHVLFAGEGADAFAVAQKLEIVPESYFATERRLKQLQEAKARQQIQLDHTPSPAPSPSPTPSPDKKTELLPVDVQPDIDSKFGTVGAVARDIRGNLAAATSTGGLTNKMPGRIGDSPVIGAGTYAENGVAAVSATGSGEMFMRSVGAYDIAAQIKYGKIDPVTATNATLDRIKAMSGQGGFIVLDGKGVVTFGFNTNGMYRASASGQQGPVVKIFKDE
jgi:L-asparaginase / beta-aspartyl-peptidase